MVARRPWIVYRDSTRGINDDDEIFVARADGSERRNLTNDPANDWGPDWSPDGTTIAFNSDRDGGALRGYLVDPDGTNLRPIDVDAWVEYPSFSPDGTRIAFMGHAGSAYRIYVADLASGAVRQLTDGPGNDGWPAWSPDGSTIAFTSERDDCRFAPPDADCWRGEPDDAHRDTWLVDCRRLEPASRVPGDRPVRRLVARRPIPAGLGPRAVRRAAGRERAAGASRRRDRPAARRHPGLALTSAASREIA